MPVHNLGTELCVYYEYMTVFHITVYVLCQKTTLYIRHWVHAEETLLYAASRALFLFNAAHFAWVVHGCFSKGLCWLPMVGCSSVPELTGGCNCVSGWEG